MAGYSGTPLAKKLGLREGMRVRTAGAPADYLELVAPLPPRVTVSSALRGDVDLLHVFVTRRTELERWLGRGLPMMRRDGMIWVSWPKKASGVATDVTEDTVRECALPLGLVDVKVCAVDETWSGLKLVIRKALR